MSHESNNRYRRQTVQTSNIDSAEHKASTPPNEVFVVSGHPNLVLTQNLSPSTKAFSIAMFTKTFKDSAYLDYLPTLLLSPEPSPILDTCLEAVSLIYCSQQSSYFSLLPQARATFHKATQRVRGAISQTANFSSDDLLASVMLLALFSVLSPDMQSNLGMWDVHFGGAIALLHARSPKFLQGKAIQNMLSHILNLGAMHAFQTKQLMSPQLLTCLSSSIQMEYSVQAHFWELLVAITQLQHTIKESECIDPAMIDQLNSTDEQIKEFYESIVQGHEEDRVWKRYGHENDYPLPRKLQPLNNLRVARMRLNESIYVHATNCIRLDKYLPGRNRTQLTSQAFTAAQVVQKMAEQIYRSIPDLFRPDRSTKEYPYNLNAWIYCLVWPLVEVMRISIVSQQFRDLVACQLDWFSKISCNDSVTKMTSESTQTSPDRER